MRRGGVQRRERLAAARERKLRCEQATKHHTSIYSIGNERRWMLQWSIMLPLKWVRVGRCHGCGLEERRSLAEVLNLGH